MSFDHHSKNAGRIGYVIVCTPTRIEAENVADAFVPGCQKRTYQPVTIARLVSESVSITRLVSLTLLEFDRWII
jgi:hypothetical protein